MKWKSLFCFLICTKLLLSQQPIQKNIKTQGINSQVNGHNNHVENNYYKEQTNIGAIYNYITIKNNSSENSPQKLTLKIEVNSRCIVFKDGDSIGIAEIDHPLKVFLSTGEFELKIKNYYHSDWIFKKNIIVKKDDIGVEKRVAFYFEIGKYLFPVRRDKNGKYGYLNYETKELCIDYQFNTPAIFEKNLASVSLNSKWGVIDYTGRYVLPCEYDKSPDFNKQFIIVYKDKKYGVFDNTGNMILPTQYDQVSITSSNFIVADSINMTCVFDNKGNEVIPFNKYLNVIITDGYPMLVCKESNSDFFWGLVDNKDKEILPIIYDKILYVNQPEFTNGATRYITKLNGIWSFYPTGSRCDTFHFQEVTEYNDHLTRVEVNDKMGYVDAYCTEVIPIIYAYITMFKRERAIVTEENGRKAIVNEGGRFLTSFKYDEIYDFDSPITPAQINGHTGFLDLNGKEITSFKYDPLEDEAGLTNNTSVIPFGNCYTASFQGKIGLINAQGKEVSNFDYDKACFDQCDNFFGGHGSDKKIGILYIGDKGTYYDEDGHRITNSLFDYAGAFYNNNRIAVVGINGSFGIMDRKGEIIVPIIYDAIDLYTDNIFIAYKGDNIIYLNFKGECLFNCK